MCCLKRKKERRRKSSSGVICLILPARVYRFKNLRTRMAFCRRWSACNHAPKAESSEMEPYHWKGLLLQSFAFDMLSNATRIITADQNDRHPLLNKPYWSKYWASHFNMRRWNDGD